MSTLYLNGVIHSVADPYATAMIVDHGMITWVGADDSAERMLRATGVTDHETVDLQGALVTPAFVDSWSTRDASDHPAEQGVFLSAGPAGTGHQVAYQQVASADQLPDDGHTGWVLEYRADETEDQRRVLRAATERPVQTVILPQNEDSVAALLDDLAGLTRDLGAAALGRAGHRLVWNGELSADQVQSLSTLGLTVTVAPDPDGTVRAPVGALLSAGVPVSWGSGGEAPKPWGLVRALLEHRDAEQRISARGGFTVATRAGLRVLPVGAVDPVTQMAGRLAPSSPATFAVWEVEALSVQAPDGRVSAWSTDTRAGTPLLPVLDAETAEPRLLATVVGGATVHRPQS